MEVQHSLRKAADLHCFQEERGRRKACRALLRCSAFYSDDSNTAPYRHELPSLPTTVMQALVQEEDSVYSTVFKEILLSDQDIL